MTNNNIIIAMTGTTLAIFFLFSLVSLSYAMKFNETDYIITAFGINNSHPFISVEGNAGGSYDPSMGDEGYHAYVFETDKGIYQISVAEGLSNKPYYGTDRIQNKEIKLNECLITEDTSGKPSFENKTVRFMDDKLKITKVNKVLSLKVVLDDPDARCKTGEHIQKIYPNRINMTNSDASFRPSGANKNKTITSVVEIPGSVDIATSSGEYQCNGIPRMGKVSGLNVHAYNRHGLESGEWTLVNEKSNGKDTNGTITGGSVSPSTYTLTGKADRDVICDTIYYKIVISGECGEGKIIEMKTSSGKPIASLKGNAKCLPG